MARYKIAVVSREFHEVLVEAEDMEAAERAAIEAVATGIVDLTTVYDSDLDVEASEHGDDDSRETYYTPEQISDAWRREWAKREAEYEAKYGPSAAEALTED